jgi:hypothetical protein
MRYLKVCGLAVAVAGALMAFIGVGTASASVVCSATEDPCSLGNRWANGTLDFSLTSGTSAQLKEPGAGGEVLNTCTGSTVKGTLENGSSTATAKGAVVKANLTWTGCSVPTSTTAGGTLEVHKIAGTSNGTVTGSDFKVTFHVLGSDCEYEVAEGTDIGTIKEGKPAVFHAEAVTVKTKGFNCPEEGEWSATYTLTEPKEKTLSIAASAAPGGVVCSATEDPCSLANRWADETLDFSLTSGTSAKLKEPGAGGEVLDVCSSSTAKGILENGSSTATAKGTVEKANLTWGECTKTTATTAGGTLEVHKIAGTSNGTVTASGFKVTVLVFGFVDCEYETGANLDVGTVKEGKPAVFHAEAVMVKTKGFGCPEEGEWSATYTLTEPKEKTLSIAASAAPGSVLCSATEDPCSAGNRWANETLDLSLPAVATAKLKEPGPGGEVLDICSSSTAKGTLENGSSTATAKGTVEKANLTWGGCTRATATTAGGTLEVRKIAGTSNGTVTGSGFKVTVLVFGFIDCEYEMAENSDVGTLTEGKPAVFTAAAVTVKTKGFGCPEEAEWSTPYTLTEPKEKTLSVAAS